MKPWDRKSSLRKMVRNEEEMNVKFTENVWQPPLKDRKPSSIHSQVFKNE